MHEHNIIFMRMYVALLRMDVMKLMLLDTLVEVLNVQHYFVVAIVEIIELAKSSCFPNLGLNLITLVECVTRDKNLEVASKDASVCRRLLEGIMSLSKVKKLMELIMILYLFFYK